MSWLDDLESEIDWLLREIIWDHGAPISLTHPKVKRLFQNLAAVRRLKQEAPYVGDHHRLSV